jgi:hypothetical protein
MFPVGSLYRVLSKGTNESEVGTEENRAMNLLNANITELACDRPLAFKEEGGPEGQSVKLKHQLWWLTHITSASFGMEEKQRNFRGFHLYKKLDFGTKD